MSSPIATSEASNDDGAVVERLRRGNAAAFADLVRANAGRLMAVAQGLMRNEADAQEALQDAFLQAYGALGKFEGRCSLSTWLHTITVRACLMKLRQKRRRPEESIDELLPKFQADGHREGVGPAWRAVDAEAMKEEEKRLVRACIDRLPEDFRIVLLLRDIQELDTQEVATMLEVNEGVVKTRLHRARQALRTLLDPYFRKG